MNKTWGFPFLLFAAFLALSCGNSGRQLQSVAINHTVNGNQYQFVATGNYSKAPSTVTPIPAEWSVQIMSPPPTQYNLTIQPFVFQCTASGIFPIFAYAPSSQDALMNGSWSGAKMVSSSVTITCP
jgi:hypothetical protein